MTMRVCGWREPKPGWFQTSACRRHIKFIALFYMSHRSNWKCTEFKEALATFSITLLHNYAFCFTHFTTSITTGIKYKLIQFYSIANKRFVINNHGIFFSFDFYILAQLFLNWQALLYKGSPVSTINTRFHSVCVKTDYDDDNKLQWQYCY